MGRKDYRHKETKKAKRDAKKASLSTIMAPPPPEVEVIRTKGKKEPREEDL